MTNVCIVPLLFCTFLASASPTWPEYDAVRTANWSLETRLAKRTFHMFEPIEISTKLHFMGKCAPKQHLTRCDGFIASAHHRGMEVPFTQWGLYHGNQRCVKEYRVGPGFTECDLVRPDTALDMSLPGTYHVWLTRRVGTYPPQSQLKTRQLSAEVLTSQKYVIEVLPYLANRVQSPQPRPDIVLPEPNAAERQKNWQVVLAPIKREYLQGEAIRIRMIRRYLGSKPQNITRVEMLRPRYGIAVVRDDGAVPPRRLIATTRIYGNLTSPDGEEDSFSYADDVWNAGFTMVEEIVPNLDVDMAQPGYYRLWFLGYLHGVRNDCYSNTVRIRVTPPLAPGIHATGNP